LGEEWEGKQKSVSNSNSKIRRNRTGKNENAKFRNRRRKMTMEIVIISINNAEGSRQGEMLRVLRTEDQLGEVSRRKLREGGVEVERSEKGDPHRRN